MRLSKCRSCGASIVWIKTPRGKSMPCDSTPAYYNTRTGNKDRIVTPNGVVIPCEIVTNPNNADGVGYVPHWGICDNPDKFRKETKIC